MQTIPADRLTPFKHPLKPKRTDFSFKSFNSPDGVKEVGKILHEKIAESWYPQTPTPKATNG